VIYEFLILAQMTTQNRSLSPDNPSVPMMPPVYSWEKNVGVTNGKQWQSTAGGQAPPPQFKELEEIE